MWVPGDVLKADVGWSMNKTSGCIPVPSLPATHPNLRHIFRASCDCERVQFLCCFTVVLILMDSNEYLLRV